MAKGDDRKEDYLSKVQELVRTYKKVFIINVDNVTSDQMHKVRKSVRGQAVVLLGKNTLIRKAIRDIISEVPEIESLLNHIYGNVGLVFTNGDLKNIREAISAFPVAAPARAGVVSGVDVVIPAGPTTIPPDKTSFFQNLGISTKLVKGCIEITADAHVLKKGTVVNASQVQLLAMMNILPFSYGVTVLSAYDNGNMFDAAMLDISDEDIVNNVRNAIKDITCISLATRIPSKAAVPHVLINAFKDLLAVSLATEINFPAAEKLKEALKNPQMFAAATTAAPQASAAKSAPAQAAAAPEEESDDGMGFGLFD